MSRWAAVATWLDGLRSAVLPPMDLSPEGAGFARDVALDLLAPDVLHRVAALPGAPFDRARFVAARTVFTAPLEWMAVLLGRGTEVELQVPSQASDTGRAWALWGELARDHGLPLRVVTRGDGLAPPTAPLVVAMGGDETIESIRPHATGRFLGFGARYSAAACETPEDARAIAMDLALHDGRGCMSPGMILATDLAAAEWLAEALAEAEGRWPRGRVSDAEHAALRGRGALARVLGRVVEGDGWSVHQLPWSHRRVASLPRSPLVVQPPDLDEALRSLAADPHLSTLGTRRPVPSAGGGRVVVPGTQQRPLVERSHDGVDWLRATLR